ncbi:MAG TPA: tautomerase family protein [Ramlibacter sp.]|nr:tautomerase family protein [Ramlibacter sp.]
MPTYTVHAPQGLLTPEHKQRIARDVTRVHNEVTGAQAFFAQVMFQEVAPGDWFMGGAPLANAQVFLHGQIRGGRPLEMKQRLLRQLIDVVTAATGLARNQAWAYIVELPPSLMAEYGHILPEPGTEAQWLSSLPADDRALMEGIGR